MQIFIFTDVWKNETLPTNSTEYTIANLDANTELTVRVGAVYLTNTTMFAPNVIGRTRPDKTVGKYRKLLMTGFITIIVVSTDSYLAKKKKKKKKES